MCLKESDIKCVKGGIVHEHEGKWWFWNETWSDRHGPFDTRRNARIMLAYYLGMLNRPSTKGQGPDDF